MVFLIINLLNQVSADCVGATKTFVWGDNVTQSCVIDRDMSNNGTAFIVGAEGITIDCDGHSLTGNDTGSGIQVEFIGAATIQHCNIAHFEKGIDTRNAEDIIIRHNNFEYNNKSIFLFDYSQDPQIYNNTIKHSGYSGIHFDCRLDRIDAYNNTIQNATYAVKFRADGTRTCPNIKTIRLNSISIDTCIKGLDLEEAIDFNFTDISINGCESAINIRNTFDYDEENVFSDVFISRSSKYDIYFDRDNDASNYSFINVTKDSRLVTVDGAATAFFKWYLDAYVNYTNGNPVEGAEVTIYDKSNTLIFNVTTNSSGYILRQNVTEYIQNSTDKTYYTDHSINVTKDGTNSTTKTFHLTENYIIGQNGPVNLTLDAPTCSDGTEYGECSSTKPKYCQNGDLISKCSVCGCKSGYSCRSDGTCKKRSGGGNGWPPAVCGDGKCAPNENYLGCAKDCPAPNNPPEQITNDLGNIIEGRQFTGGSGNIFRFIIKQENHTAQIDGLTDANVSLWIWSNPFYVTLNIGETKTLDLDGNSLIDFEIKLNSIENKTADLIFSEIQEIIPAEDRVINAPEEEKAWGDIIWKIILGVFAVLIIAIILIYRSKQEKRRYEGYR